MPPTVFIQNLQGWNWPKGGAFHHLSGFFCIILTSDHFDVFITWLRLPSQNTTDGVASTTEMNFLTVLETTHLRSRSGRVRFWWNQLSGLQTATFSQCPHPTFPWCLFPPFGPPVLSRPPVLSDQSPTLMTSPNLNSFLKARFPNTVTWRVRSSPWIQEATRLSPQHVSVWWTLLAACPALISI